MSSSCACRAFAPPPTPPARKCSRRCAISIAGPARGTRTPRRPAPRKFEGSRPRLAGESLENYALRALARRPHSQAELRRKLERRALNAAEVESLLEGLAARGWLDDRRFALGYARGRAENRRFGRYRITRELRQRGVADELIEAALAEVFPAERDERALVRKRLERRLRGQKPPYGLKLLRSLYASLLRAGFPSAIIRDELFRRGGRAWAEEFEGDEDERP